MSNQEQASEAGGAWAKEEFSGIRLGEKRLEKRLVRVAERLFLRPQSPINQASETWAETKAAYRLFDNEKVEAREIFASHRARTRHRLQAVPLVLAIQDTTYLNFSPHRKTQGLGPIGDRQREPQGLIMHSTLAVQPDGGSLGLLTHDLWVRQGYGTKAQRKHTAITQKESYKWLRALEQTAQAAATTPGRVVTVCDREADVYEFMAEAQRLEAEFVIRAAWNRGVAGRTRLWEHLAQQPSCGRFTFDLPGRGKQPQRTATVELRFAAVVFRPPQRDRSVAPRKLPALRLYAVFVKEVNASAEASALEWMLLTNIPVASFADALERLTWYKCRWQIEVYHKVLKSGCRVEACRLETAARLRRYITLLSIIAWRLHWLTQVNRARPAAPARTILSEEELAALQLSVPPKPQPSAIQSVRDAVRAIAGLGGFLGRTRDGEPGVTAIWRGWQRLADLTLMWELTTEARLVGNS